MVTQFYSAAAADSAEQHYDFNRKGGFPDDAPTFELQADVAKGTLWIAKAIALCQLAPSSSAGKNLVINKAVHVDDARIDDPNYGLAPGATYRLVVGGKTRKYARVTVK